MSFLVRRILLWAALIVVAAGAAVAGEDRIVRPETADIIHVGRELDILEDPGGNLTLEDILREDAQGRFAPAATDWPTFGVSAGAVWTRARLDLAHDPAGAHRRLQVNALHPDTVDVYAVDDTGQTVLHFAGGLSRPESFTQRKLSVSLGTLDASRFTLYTRMTTLYISTLTMTLIPAGEELRQEMTMERILGPLFGAIGLATLFCLLLWIYLRERLYGYGFGFTVGICIATQGYINADRLYWPDVMLQPDVNRALYFISLGLLPLFAMMFTSHFLETVRRHPRWHQAAWTMAILIAIAYLTFYAVNPHAFLYLRTAAAALAVAMMLCMLAMAFKDRLVAARAYLLIAVPALLFMVTTNVASLGLLQRHPVLTSISIVGMTYLACGIAAALAASFRRRLEATVTARTSALSSAIEALSEAHEAKNRMLGVVAHDLRNPLGAIKSATELLLTVPMSEEKRDSLLKSIRDGVGMTLTMTEDLLDVAAIEEGSVRLKPETCDLETLVRSRLELFRLAAVPKGVMISIQASPMPPVWADPKRLGQALDNLLSNAVKFSPPNAEVVVTLRAEGARARLIVADQGAGIPAEELNRIFRPFERASPQPTGGERSTGLGLAIVKRLVEAQGGHIVVHSEPGAGSRFELFLPLAAEAAR